MRPNQRQDMITSLVGQMGEITVEELAEKLDVSKETIRRDLTRLDAIGRLRKYHGGARALESSSLIPELEGPFASRMSENSDAKRKIARAAAALLKPEDSIFIDTGTTTVLLADEIAKQQSLLVITNSHRIASVVATNPSHKVFLIGGAYGVDAGESLGPLALEQIGKFRAKCAVITIGAVDASSAMDYDLQEAEIAKAMIERADRLIVLADHTKLDKRAVFEVVPLSAIDVLVTDREPPKALSAALAEANVMIVLA